MWSLTCWHTVLSILGAFVLLNCISVDQVLPGPRPQVRGMPGTLMPSKHTQSGMKGEGCWSVMRPTEVALHTVLDHFVEPATNMHDPTSSYLQITKGSSIKKRSFRRAKQRALTWGYTWYHGRLVTPASLGCQTCKVRQLAPSNTKPVQALHPAHQWRMTEPRCLRNRCGVLTWNASGLTAAALQEVLQWAGPQHVQIVILTETRWQSSRTWNQQGWH